MNTLLLQQIRRIFPVLCDRFNVEIARAWLRNMLTTKEQNLLKVAGTNWIHEVLIKSFTWAHTPEGMSFWDVLHEKARSKNWKVHDIIN